MVGVSFLLKVPFVWRILVRDVRTEQLFAN